jgi:hypothetical protein
MQLSLHHRCVFYSSVILFFHDFMCTNYCQLIKTLCLGISNGLYFKVLWGFFVFVYIHIRTTTISQSLNICFLKLVPMALKLMLFKVVLCQTADLFSLGKMLDAILMQKSILITIKELF